MSNDNQQKPPCPEFPFFGVKYPDARCIDGYLWDLDKYEDGHLYGGGEVPCPFCNTENAVEYLLGDCINGDEEKTRVAIEKSIEKLKIHYGYENERTK